MAPPTPSDPQTVAGELRVVLGQLSRRMREQGGRGECTQSQASVLLRLERDGPATMTALARAEGVRPQSMGSIIAVLEEIGLVSAAPDPKDGRKKLLSLTASAREQFASGRLARDDWLAGAIAGRLTPAEQARLADCLDLLQRLATA